MWLVGTVHKCLYVEMCGPEYEENMFRVVSSGGGSTRTVCNLEATQQGRRGCLSKVSEAQFIKLTLQVPRGAETVTPPSSFPAPDTSSEIR